MKLVKHVVLIQTNSAISAIVSYRELNLITIYAVRNSQTFYTACQLIFSVFLSIIDTAFLKNNMHLLMSFSQKSVFCFSMM